MLIIHRIAKNQPVNVEAAQYINGLRAQFGVLRVRSHRFDSVQFVTTAGVDPKDSNKSVLLYEAYILYHEEG